MDQHLTEIQIAQFVEALENNDPDSIPEDIRDHVSECFECRSAILEVSDILTEVDLLSNFLK